MYICGPKMTKSKFYDCWKSEKRENFIFENFGRTVFQLSSDYKFEKLKNDFPC